MHSTKEESCYHWFTLTQELMKPLVRCSKETPWSRSGLDSLMALSSMFSGPMNWIY